MHVEGARQPLQRLVVRPIKIVSTYVYVGVCSAVGSVGGPRRSTALLTSVLGLLRCARRTNVRALTAVVPVTCSYRAVHRMVRACHTRVNRFLQAATGKLCTKLHGHSQVWVERRRPAIFCVDYVLYRAWRCSCNVPRLLCVALGRACVLCRLWPWLCLVCFGVLRWLG